MSALASHFEAVADHFTDVFGEAVTYTPLGGSPVSCTWQVLRGPLRTHDENGGLTNAYMIEVVIPKEDVASLNLNGDKVALKARTTDAETTDYSLSVLIEDNPAFYRIGLRGG